MIDRASPALTARACPVAATLLVAACGSGPSAPPVTAADTPVNAAPPPPPAPATVHRTAAELDPALATERAPDLYRARFATSNGTFVIEVHRDWAPNGADRFYDLVKMGFYDDTRFFRAITGFMVQFGLPGDPQVAAKWREATIPDDPAKQSNLRGYVAFAQTSSPNSRTTQVFVDYRDNAQLDASNFAPFGVIVEGMDVVSTLYKGYGEGAPNGGGPSQDRIQSEGNAYLDAEFPKLDRIVTAQIVAP
jgi:peptidyl-prolyl cis-trans isomerase A (cyclophilin A)